MFFRRSPVRMHSIENYFFVQQWWIRVLGIAIPKSRKQCVFYALYKTVLLMIMFQINCLFVATVYLDILSGSFESIAYSLPQMVIMMISTFYLAYFQANTAYLFELMEYMNANFQFRSAKGELIGNHYLVILCFIQLYYIQVSHMWRHNGHSKCATLSQPTGK